MSADVALQDAVHAALLADAGVSALVGDRVYDNAPSGVVYPYVTFGPSQVIDGEIDCVGAEESYLQLDVWTQDGGNKRQNKVICAAIKKALHKAQIALPGDAALVQVVVESIRVMDDPAEHISHGVISIRADTEDHS